MDSAIAPGNAPDRHSAAATRRFVICFGSKVLFKGAAVVQTLQAVTCGKLRFELVTNGIITLLSAQIAWW